MGITQHFRKAVVCLFICIGISNTLAYWAEPVLLDELNDFQNGYAASRPTISADENIIFFVRKDETGQSRVWEAQRNQETGLFDNHRMLTELRKNGKSVYGTWISEDNKRLYYCGANISWTQRQLWMATRNSPDEKWSDARLHNELQIQDLLACCSLTSDEKYILFQATPNTTPRYRLNYYATRNSLDESFSTPQEAYELNAIGADAPTITPDGLTVYFFIASEENEGFQKIWIGHRNSLNVPFSDFMPVEEINTAGHSVMGWASPSWDGQRLYYLQRNTQPNTSEWDLYATGIFVSHWIDPPEVVVNKNLVELIESKGMILDQLQAAIEKEVETLDILNMLQEMARKGSREFKAIQKTKIQIHKALRDEILAQSKIRSSIRELEEGLSYFRMEKPDRPERSDSHQRTKRHQ